jgi:hypothetical protein
MILSILRPILVSFLLSDSVKQLVVDLLEGYSKSTETTIDDTIVEMVKQGIGYEKKSN